MRNTWCISVTCQKVFTHTVFCPRVPPLIQIALFGVASLMLRAPLGLTALRRARPSLLRWGRTLCTQKPPAEENLRWWHGSFDPDPIKDIDEEGTASAHAVLVS